MDGTSSDRRSGLGLIRGLSLTEALDAYPDIIVGMCRGLVSVHRAASVDRSGTVTLTDTRGRVREMPMVDYGKCLAIAMQMGNLPLFRSDFAESREKAAALIRVEFADRSVP